MRISLLLVGPYTIMEGLFWLRLVLTPLPNFPADRSHPQHCIVGLQYLPEADFIGLPH